MSQFGHVLLWHVTEAHDEPLFLVANTTPCTVKFDEGEIEAEYVMKLEP